MKNVKKIALVALCVLVEAAPVAMLLTACFIEGTNTLWCLFLVATALTYLVMGGATFLNVQRTGGEITYWIKGMALLGSMATFMILAVQYLWLSNTVSYFAVEPFNSLPMGLSFWYLFTTAGIMLLTVTEWRTEKNWHKLFLSGAFIFCATIAIIGGCEVLTKFGISVSEVISDITVFIFAANIMAMIAAMAMLLTVVAFDDSKSGAARWCAAFGAVAATGVVLLMLTSALSNWGLNIPEALREAFIWMFALGPIGCAVVGAIAGLKKLLGR